MLNQIVITSIVLFSLKEQKVHFKIENDIEKKVLKGK